MKLKELRIQKGLTQKKLGSLIGYGQTSIRDWESGKVQPNIETLCKLADIFECTVDFLIGYTDDFGIVQSRSEELAPSEHELLKKYRSISPEGKEKALDYIDLIKRDEENKRNQYRGNSGVK